LEIIETLPGKGIERGGMADAVGFHRCSLGKAGRPGKVGVATPETMSPTAQKGRASPSLVSFCFGVDLRMPTTASLRLPAGKRLS
jgi:hypothetical protein